MFGRYNAVAYLAGALGALLAGGPAFVQRFWTSTPTGNAWFLVFPLGAGRVPVAGPGLSPELELSEAATGAPLERSRSTVTKLASLFAVDAFAGGFVITVFIVYWFSTELGASKETMSLVFFAAGLLQAGSSVVAPRLAARIGLLPTMVFTHLPSNILLMLIPLAPNLAVAIAILLLRFALSQMDVPTRQAYIAAMVDPQERTAAAAATNSARYVARPFGPLIGTFLMNNVAIGAPWVAAGALKSLYDVALWRVFSSVPLPDAARTEGSTSRSSSTTSGAGSSTRSIRTMHPSSSSTHRRIVVVAPRSPRTSAITQGRPICSRPVTSPWASRSRTNRWGSIAEVIQASPTSCVPVSAIRNVPSSS